MGLTFSSLVQYFWSDDNEERRLLMLGLDCAGKTTMLYKLKLGEIVTTIPTIGFNVESVVYNNTTLTVWDMGGQDKLRKLWRYHYEGAEGLIFVVDSSDTARLDIAKDELHRVLSEDELPEGIPVLIYANKQDQPRALSASEVSEQLNLEELTKRRIRWHIQPCCAISKQGLYEGLEWLAKTMKFKHTRQ